MESPKRGGKREGAGRKPAGEMLERHTIWLAPSQVAYLRSVNEQLSIAVRRVIDEHKARK